MPSPSVDLRSASSAPTGRTGARTPMKPCPYCGRDNQDAVTHCQECGTEFPAPPPASATEGPWGRITTLDHDVEAGHLRSELDALQIPHVMVSYRDSAFDGLFQTARGWGHLEAPMKHRDAILTVLRDIRQSSGQSQGAEPQPTQ